MQPDPAWAPWPAVFRRINAFLNQWDYAEFGPGHIVLSDYNLGDDNITSCLEQIARGEIDDHGLDEISATAAFLRDLLTIPEYERDAVEAWYFNRGDKWNQDPWWWKYIPVPEDKDGSAP